MNINDLRKIGNRLKKEIPPLVWELYGSSSLGRGASGDKTFPIDRRAEDIVFEEVEKMNEPLTVVSEEYGFKDIRGGGPRLLVDPIDGSRNALGGIALFSTSIALIDGDTVGETSLGYVINLISGDEYWASKGGGSFLNGKPVMTQSENSMKVIAYEASTPSIDIPRIIPLISLYDRARCFGSTALDMAFLSHGALSTFIVPSPSRSFDFAAGYLIIKEAGGIVTDLEGKNINGVKADVSRSSSILASCNEELHRKALEVLRD